METNLQDAPTHANAVMSFLSEAEREDRALQMQEASASHTALKTRIQEKHSFDPDTIDEKEVGKAGHTPFRQKKRVNY